LTRPAPSGRGSPFLNRFFLLLIGRRSTIF
jgi:hypothetical protein